MKTRSVPGQTIPNPGASLTQDVAQIVRAHASPKVAERELLALLDGVPIASGMRKAEAPVDLGLLELPPQLGARASAEEDSSVRNLHQCLRALRREAEGRNSPAAVRVLANDALRGLLETAGWRRLGELASALQSGGPSVLLAPREADARALYGALSRTGDPSRFSILADLALKTEKVQLKARAKSPDPLSATEKAALVDILASQEPQRGALVKERLKRGDVSGVRDMLLERLLPTSTEAAPSAAKPEAGEKAAGGLVFDLGTNQWVSKDKSWKYEVRLAQLFDYEVKGVIDGREELAARLEASATDPTTGEVSPPPEEIAAFIADLSRAARTNDPQVGALLGHGFDMVFSTTDGGDKPVGALWELPRQAVADLFDALTRPEVRAHVRDVARKQEAAEKTEMAEVRASLGDLLDKYPGVPRRHKRQHAALINIGLAGQSVEELGREDGALPRSKTTLTPQSLKREYADAEHLKVRFLFTDQFSCHVVSDQTFNEVVEKHHFPPNHELLSYNRPIAGSGYLILHQGKIAGIEDDTIMLPGKLPDGLPPAIEVFRRQGFGLDEKAIAASSLVLDWEGFVKGAQSPNLPPAPTGTPREISDRLAQAPHGERPALVASLLKKLLGEARASGLPEDAARARTAQTAGELLGELRIINVGARTFRSGDLPSDKSEFDDLIVDAALASFLVRKVAS